jgi:hypothetical protein
LVIADAARDRALDVVKEGLGPAAWS